MTLPPNQPVPVACVKCGSRGGRRRKNHGHLRTEVINGKREWVCAPSCAKRGAAHV